MSFVSAGGRALLAEAAVALAALRDRRLALLLGLFAMLLLLAAQAPLAYTVDVGVEDGTGSDLPLVAGFHPREQDVQGTFRWTRDSSYIRLPGMAVRPILLTLRLIAVSAEVAQRGPQEVELWANGARAARLPVRPQGAIYRILLPPAPGGDQQLELRSATFVPTGDERAIGAGLAAFSVRAPPDPALPAWRSTLLWLGAAALAWLVLRRAGFGPGAALAMLLPLTLLAGLAALLDPPRFAFGAGPAALALGLGWLLALLLCSTPAALLAGGMAAAGLATAATVARATTGIEGGHELVAWVATAGLALLAAGALRPALAELCRRLGIAAWPGHWRWLALMAVVALATRYGGKIYPDSMPGDIGFHVNRFADVARGTLLIVSRNRGVDFPYPPALYLLLAPLTLPGLDRRVALQLGAALLDALSPLLVYVIGVSALTPPAPLSRARKRGEHWTPLIAAAIYTFSAAGYMTTWWNFSTHIFAQFAHLLLVAALVALWPALADDRRPTTADRRTTHAEGVPGEVGYDERQSAGSFGRTPAPLDPPSLVVGRWSLVNSSWSLVTILVLLQLLVYLGHFGFWMNTTLLGVMGLAALLWAAWRGRVAWAAFRPLLAAFALAQALAALLFYSGYAGMLLAQAQAAAAGGLTGLAGRDPVSRERLWAILWDQGLRAHFGFFPLPLALCGGLILWATAAARGRPGLRTLGRRGVVLALMAGTFAIALFFAALPFLSGSTLSSRWLMFSAWAVAVGAAYGAERLWRAGIAGKVAVATAGGYVLWATASMWLMALAWRVRPPEPF
jgi:hypothetical protein